MKVENFTIVAAVNNRDILQHNLLRSPDLANDGKNEILLKEGYASAARAYNSAIDEAVNDVIVFVHQDIYFPEAWFASLRSALEWLAGNDPDWGVLGCFGSTATAHGGLGQVYTNGRGVHGRELTDPQPIETLDEIVLILRRSSGLRFDEDLPHYHLYGTDICLTARASGRTSYAFQGFCIHNTNQLIQLPEEFYVGYRYIKKKWSNSLPIHASCMTISMFDRELTLRKLRDFTDKWLGVAKQPKRRVGDPTTLVNAEREE